MNAKAELLGWAVCGNISDHLRGGTDPEKFYQGTRMFSPGTKVFLGPAYWGVAGESIHVVGLRRISREFVNCVIEIGVIENLRVTSIYSARKWAVLTRLNAELFQTKADAEEYLDRCAHALRSEGPEKLLPVERTGPWGPYETSAYRKK